MIREMFLDHLNSLSLEDQVNFLVNRYHNSPWYQFGKKITKKEMIKKAKNEGILSVEKYINDLDIEAFHKEEYANGCL